MAKVREIPWPDEFSDLKRIEEFMVCGICYEYMETSVLTPCSHNYCSLCIRKYLHYKTQCPACFHVFFEKDLYVNRAMDGLIQHYLQVREKLINLIENRIVYNKVVQKEEEPPSTPPVRSARQIPKSPQIQETKQSEPKTPVSYSLFASTSKCNDSSPVASRSPKVIPTIAKIFNTPKRKDVGPIPIVNVKTVSCPVCKVDISEHHINVHLDACLKREGVTKEKPKVVKRPPLPKLVLRVMKDAELRKKMKEFGLSTQGDRRTLENRFTRYSTIYNAECDKVNPRSVPELIKQCEMEEKQERKMDSFLVSASALNRLQIERNAKEEKIEEAQKTYRIANKSSFDKLIEEVRNRRKMEKANTEDSASGSSSKQSLHTENTSENISENEENITYNPSAEIAFQDSDSDESCPLQHYRNDGDTKYLSLNLNESGPCTSTSESPVKRLQKSPIKNTVQSKKPIVTKNVTNNVYEASTDESSDDEVINSPVINKKLNPKRVRLSNKSLSKGNLPIASSSKMTDNDSVQQENREAVARDLCNSIINDFSFDGLSDDSSNEFADKPQYNKSIIEKVKMNETLKKDNDLNRSIPRKASDPSCDKIVPEDSGNADLDKDICNFVREVSFDILNEDSFSEFINTSVASSKEVQKENLDESAKVSHHLNDAKSEKENNGSSANDNSNLPVNESTVSRPVRKRNRPSRFVDMQTTNKEKEEKTLNRLSEDSQESESPDSLKNSTTANGSIKRRRGRPKINSVDQSSDESQNPPKRIMRRRQTVPDRNLC